MLSPSEQDALSQLPAESQGIERLRAWVRKEAVLKATGFGLAVEPSELTVHDDQVVSYPPILSPCLDGGVQLFAVPEIAGHVTALAVLADGPVEIVVHPDL